MHVPGMDMMLEGEQILINLTELLWTNGNK